MNRKDWLLMAVSFAGDDYLSPAQLQKSLFIFKEEMSDRIGPNFYTFVPYNYGPFCKEIYLDAEELASTGLIKFRKPTGKRWKGYVITDEGKKYLASLNEEYSEDDAKYMLKVVNWTRSLTFKQMLSTIYKFYPDYKRNSAFPEW